MRFRSLSFQFYDSPIKRLHRACVFAQLRRFNSMIVRLKETLDPSRHHRNEKFQFYDSPIKRITNYDGNNT